jgi:hypothetical protein
MVFLNVLALPLRVLLIGAVNKWFDDWRIMNCRGKEGSGSDVIKKDEANPVTDRGGL